MIGLGSDKKKIPGRNQFLLDGVLALFETTSNNSDIGLPRICNKRWLSRSVLLLVKSTAPGALDMSRLASLQVVSFNFYLMLLIFFFEIII